MTDVIRLSFVVAILCYTCSGFRLSGVLHYTETHIHIQSSVDGLPSLDRARAPSNFIPSEDPATPNRFTHEILDKKMKSYADNIRKNPFIPFRNRIIVSNTEAKHNILTKGTVHRSTKSKRLLNLIKHTMSKMSVKGIANTTITRSAKPYHRTRKRHAVNSHTELTRNGRSSHSIRKRHTYSSHNQKAKHIEDMEKELDQDNSRTGKAENIDDLKDEEDRGNGDIGIARSTGINKRHADNSHIEKVEKGTDNKKEEKEETEIKDDEEDDADEPDDSIGAHLLNHFLDQISKGHVTSANIAHWMAQMQHAVNTGHISMDTVNRFVEQFKATSLGQSFGDKCCYFG